MMSTIMTFHSSKQKARRYALHENETSSSLLTKLNSINAVNQCRKISTRFLPLQKNALYSQGNINKLENARNSSRLQCLIRNGVQSRRKRDARKREEVSVNIAESLELKKTIWCLYDCESKKYLGFREDSKRQIASLTKIMTTIAAIQIIDFFALPLSLKVKVTQTSKNMIGTSADLKSHFWVSIKDLLYGVMLPSGNDAAYSIAQYFGFIVSKSSMGCMPACCERQGAIDLTKESTSLYVQQFIKLMNEKARELKLLNTGFSNPHGLPNALNTSSAKDIIKLSRYCAKNKLFKEIMNSQTYPYSLFQEPEHLELTGVWKNTNRLLERGWEGVKTGYTISAGNCLASIKQGVFIVVLNSTDSEKRFTDTERIYSWYKTTYLKRPIKSAIARNPSQLFQTHEAQIPTQSSI